MLLEYSDLIDAIKYDPIDGVIKLCDKVKSLIDDGFSGWSEEHYSILSEAYVLLTALEELHLISYPAINLKLTNQISDDCIAIYGLLSDISSYYKKQRRSLELDSLRNHFLAELGGTFCYEFSQGDLDKVQTLINELRNEITSSSLFEDTHRQRLLKRIEKLQSELHKKVSDLDRFWGLVGDAGVALGKFGKDAKPIVDRIHEITQIIWRTQARAEELPSNSGFPLLDNQEEHK